jgi:LmbE family N-acetylglucosaminyl deacetylase
VQQPLSLLLVNPHPDDEALALGGLISAITEAGGTVVIVTCTGGELGISRHMEIESVEQMTGIRLREMEAAIEILGAKHEWLGYRDSGMDGEESNKDPRAFANADLDEARDRLLALIRRYRPSVIVTQAENGLYGHPDHIMAHRVGVAAFDAAGNIESPPLKLYFATTAHSKVRRMARMMNEAGIESPFSEMDVDVPPIGLPDERVTLRLDVRRWLDQKERAVMAHFSQMGGREMWGQFPASAREEFSGTEHLALAASRVETSQPERHPFDGIVGVPASFGALFEAP